MARADGIGDPFHRMPGVEQAGHGLHHADVGLAAGDDEGVAAVRQAREEAFLGGGREVELGERGVAERGDLGHQRPEAVGVLLGADDVDAELARRRAELDAAPEHGLGVVDRRHQARLRVDDQEGAVGGIAEHAHRRLLAARDGRFSAMPRSRRSIGDNSRRAACRRHAMPMNAADYRESLRRYKPRVWVDGERIESVADAPQLRPGINAMGVSYDYALRDDLAPVMRAVQASSGKTRQPDAADRQQQRRPAEQARGGAHPLPGDRLRPALPRARRASAPCSRRRRGSMPRPARATASASSPTCTTSRTRT